MRSKKASPPEKSFPSQVTQYTKIFRKMKLHICPVNFPLKRAKTAAFGAVSHKNRGEEKMKKK